MNNKIYGIPMEFLYILCAALIPMFIVQNHLDFENHVNNFILFFTYLIEYIFYVIFIKKDKIKNDRVYSSLPWIMGSYANFFSQTEGHRWSSSYKIKKAMKNGDLLLNKFRFTSIVKRYLFDLLFPKKFENFECKINAKQFVKSGIVFGQMGGGKTEFYNSIINQNVFNRYLIYDTKGDYVSNFYNPKRDIILNPYDERSHIWNPFEEAITSPFIMEIFIINLLNAVSGEKKDFFSASSKDRYLTIFNDIHYKKKSLSPREKFHLFIEQLKMFFKSVEMGTKDSEKDVVSTMKLTFEFLDYMDFRIQNNTPTFTINDFLEENNSKLFLLNKDDQKTRLTPFLTGFIATFNAVLLSKEDRKGNTTLFVLDEYLTFAKNLDDETLEGMHTRIRSKGGCLLPGVQFFPQGKNEELTQKILNSATYWFLFQGIDTFTLEKINETIGKVRYKKGNIDRLHLHDDYKSQVKNFNTEESHLLNPTTFQSLGDRFEHICFIPSKKLLYQAYTPMVSLTTRAKSFILSKDIEEYYRSK